MKLYKTKKDPELYYYFNTKGVKLWCFRHRYYDALGKRREKYKQGCKSENEAYRDLLEVKTSILNGEVKQVKNSNLTISEWLDIWYETHKNEWKISSCSQRENAIKYQMKPLLGKYKLAELDKSTYKRVYINELLKKYKPSTVQLFHRLFKIAINAAVDDELIPRNRFNKITIPNEEKTVENFFTAEELNEFIAAAKKHENITNYSIILLLAFTGLRKGELAGDKHPVTGVPYDADGFPIFKSKGEVILKEADFKKSRPTHFRKCSKALYEQIIKDPDLASKFTKEEIQMFKQGETPKHYTWHHHQDTGRMQLVDYQIHHDTGHTGGYKIWGKDSDK
ncbi:HNH endonuclease [Bacillus wiedmannii]|uniref:HNH endonuclease n=1 Tax=Bacillus wiedmannii TaxID=1890302 RepID=UPI00211D65CD|nr:HNH endonuclease [Bacillus wiedmannii]